MSDPETRTGTERMTLSFERGRHWLRGAGFAVIAVSVAFTADRVMHLFVQRPPDWIDGWVTAALLAAVAFVLPRLLAHARQPRGASITWDDEGVTEWDGDAVRAAIRWEDAHLFVRRRPVGEGVRPQIRVAISDAASRIITVDTAFAKASERERRSLAPPADVDWLIAHAERRAETTEQPPRSDRVGDDGAHPAGRHPLTVLASFATYPSFVLAAVARSDAGVWFAAFAAVGAALLVYDRARRLGPLSAEASKLSAAEPVTLEPSEQGLLAIDAHGRERVLELDGFAHPDAMLESRSGPAWLVAPPTDDGGYRGAGRVRPTALESDAVRQARRARRRGVLLELAVRGAFVVYALLLALEA